MPFLELTVPCRESERPRYEHALEDVGALAVTMLDANADTDNEHAILEPGVGQTPLWDTITLTALFPHNDDALLLHAPLDDRKGTRLHSSHKCANRMHSPACIKKNGR